MRNFQKNLIPKIFHRQFPWVFTKMSLTIHWSLWIFMYQCDNKDRNTTLKLFSSNEILRIFSQLFYNTKKTIASLSDPALSQKLLNLRIQTESVTVGADTTVYVWFMGLTYILYVCTKARHIPFLNRLGFYSAPLLFSWKYK